MTVTVHKNTHDCHYELYSDKAIPFVCKVNTFALFLVSVTEDSVTVTVNMKNLSSLLLLLGMGEYIIITFFCLSVINDKCVFPLLLLAVLGDGGGGENFILQISG